MAMDGNRGYFGPEVPTFAGGGFAEFDRLPRALRQLIAYAPVPVSPQHCRELWREARKRGVRLPVFAASERARIGRGSRRIMLNCYGESFPQCNNQFPGGAI